MQSAPVCSHDGASTAHNRLQVARYPTELIEIWNLRCRTRVTLRPVLPQDAPLIADLIRRISGRTRRNRFHGATNGLSDAHLQHMSCVDYRKHMAFVILTGQQEHEQVIAEARYVVDEAGPGDIAEFAITVDDQWLRQGLGTRSMQALTRAAQAAGLFRLRGAVLAHNQPMLALMRYCRFDLTPDEQDDSIIHSQIDLHHVPPRGVSMRWTNWRHWQALLRRPQDLGLVR